MKQYSFLIEAITSDLEYKILDPIELDSTKRHDVCQLLERLGKDSLKYDQKSGVTDRYNKMDFPDSKYDKRILQKKDVIFQRFFVCESNNHIIGLIHYKEFDEQWNQYEEKQGWFSSIVIDPNFRKMGIGSRLMELAKKWVKKNRPSIVVFLGVSTNNVGGLALYTKYGFKPVNQLMVCKL